MFIHHGSCEVRAAGGTFATASSGDAVFVVSGTVWELKPKDQVGAIRVLLAPDFMVQQVLWQLPKPLPEIALLQQRLRSMCLAPCQVIRAEPSLFKLLLPGLHGLSIATTQRRLHPEFYDRQRDVLGVMAVVMPSVRTRFGNLAHLELTKRFDFAAQQWIRVVNPEVQAALDVIDLEYATALTLDSVAERVSLSSRHLSRLFFNEMGMSTKQYMNLIRVRHMGVLLSSQPVTVEEATARVGWRSTKQGLRSFREVLGVTPTQFRARFDDAAQPA
jgi:AraC-like DNA-binding protein